MKRIAFHTGVDFSLQTKLQSIVYGIEGDDCHTAVTSIRKPSFLQSLHCTEAHVVIFTVNDIDVLLCFQKITNEFIALCFGIFAG